MNYCKNCVYPDTHPLNLIFDDDGLCSGCLVHKEKDVIDWDSRFDKLKKIVGSYKNYSSDNYDCIVPVSGGHDSFFVVHVVKKILGLNPLLVTYNTQFNTDIGVRNLALLRESFDCDIMTLTVNPESVKKITRATMRRLGSIYWHVIAGQTVFPVQIATRMKIPLIIWGAHQGIDQVGMFSHYDEVEMTRKYRKEHDLMGFEAEDLISEFDNLSEEDLVQYIYPSNEEIASVGVKGIYLNNYMRWDSLTQHEKMIELYGYETSSQTRTYDTFNNANCYLYSDVHDYIKFVKHGYGKVFDHVSRDIRLGHLNRIEGVEIIKKYSNQNPVNLELFLNWIGMTENGFHFIIDQFRNKRLWYRDKNWEWQLISNFCFPQTENSTIQIELSRKSLKGYVITPSKLSTDSKDNFVLIGRGSNA